MYEFCIEYGDGERFCFLYDTPVSVALARKLLLTYHRRSDMNSVEFFGVR